jgi:hypothetical protein
MAYLDNTTEITIDAVLTRRGRQKLAENRGNLNITKFALSDDEIDYSLYDTAHPKGSAYYDAAIRALPILESGVDETQVMKYKLMTMPKGQEEIPTINIGNISFTGTNKIKIYANSSLGTSTQPQQVTITTTGTNPDLNNSFTIILADNEAGSISGATLVTTQNVTEMTAIYNLDGRQFTYSPPSNTSIDRSFSTTMTIIGNNTGASLTVPIEIQYITAS